MLLSLLHAPAALVALAAAVLARRRADVASRLLALWTAYAVGGAVVVLDVAWPRWLLAVPLAVGLALAYAVWRGEAWARGTVLALGAVLLGVFLVFGWTARTLAPDALVLGLGWAAAMVAAVRLPSVDELAERAAPAGERGAP